jgi:hypothetical protein
MASATLIALMITAASPRELGDIRFGRDLAQAIAEAKRSDKPILILFDEVPGCATCTTYGDSVLRQPLLVEAAETLFVPVAIYNNLGGKDREALDSFREPTWNNPVVRIVDAEKNMLAPRVNGDYTAAGLARAMVTALERAKKDVPEYLALFAAESEAEARGTERAVFWMYCFWSGEACLGGIDGVVATRTGFFEGHEVVEVELDPTKITAAALADRKCGELIRKKAIIRPSEKDDKYNLKATPYRNVPLTPLQATRVNALIASGGDPVRVLSPRQRAVLESSR